MKSLILVFMVLLSITAMARESAQPVSSRKPVLVELFTSEGCSSCPPADAFLAQLDRQPIAGAEMIVLSEHVDYWNHLGWKDAYSSRFFSERQSAYARRFGLDSVYTPQMIVEGATEFTGSDTQAAQKAFSQAVQSSKLPVRIASISQRSPDSLMVHVEADALPSSFTEREAEIFVVLALNHAESHVSAGENGGRTLTHVAVARSFLKAGVTTHETGFAQNIELNIGSDRDTSNLRVIVFVQEPRQGKIIGATQREVAQ